MKPKSLFAAAALLLTSLITNQAHGSVWATSASWSPAYEQRYQEWVRSSWTKNVFAEAGPLSGVKVDCADAVYTMRLLFSYNNGLPFAVKDPSSSRNVISNEMKRFDSIAAGDARLRAFAQYLYGMLGTSTLADDSYPVAIGRETIHSGVFIKTDKATHHSWTVHDVDRNGVPFLLYASRPAKTVLLERHGYPSAGFLWGQQDLQGRQIDANLQTAGDVASGVGFRMYRYPSDLQKPVWQVPGYSLDQYQIQRLTYARSIQRALQITQESPGEHAARLLKEACAEATERIASVQDAIKAMSRSSSSCFSASEYDDLSTPSRDSRAVAVFQDLVSTYRSNSSSIGGTTGARIAAIVANRDDGSYCPLRIGSGTTMTLGEAVNFALKDRWSSNPNDTLLARWGRERSPSSRAASCPTY